MINEKKNESAIVKDNYTLYLYSKLQKSQDDIKNGKVYTIKESKEMMRKNMKVLIST